MRNRFNKEEKQFIFDNYKGITTQELTKMFNERFNKNIPSKKIRYYKKRHKLCSGVDTTFKKGVSPHNTKEVGYEFYNEGQGYIFIKTDKGNWVSKQRYIWEQHYGKIPNGYCVVFANQDRNDFSLENLILVRNKDLMVAKNRKLLTNDKELTKTGVLVAQLINKLCEKRTPSK